MLFAILLFAAALSVPAAAGAYSWIVAGLIAVFVCGLGAAAHSRIGFGLPGDVLREYKPTILPGETAVLVQCKSNETRSLATFLQEGDIEEPVLFIIRPYLLGGSDATLKSRELFSAEQMRLHAISCAESHRPGPPSKNRKSIFSILGRWDEIIESVREDLAQAVELSQSITPSAEWLLDNFYIIKNQIHDVRHNLPDHYQEILPSLDSVSRHEVNLRILCLAEELAGKTDGNITAASIENFLGAYQNFKPLSIAELWAFPLMVRYALIADLAYRSLRVSRRQHDRELAHFWASRALNAGLRCPERLPMIFAEISARIPVLPPHFVIHLIDQLTEEESAFAAARKWLESNLDVSFQDLVRREHALQSAKQVSIANDVTSLRRLAQLDWREMFEKLSPVDAILRQDAVYAGSDFPTRDACRRAVEGIARYSECPEIDVAQAAIKFSAQAETERHGHVVYFLIDKGRRRLESALACRLPLSERRLRWLLDHSGLVYFAGIFFGTFATLGIGLALAEQSGTGLWALLGFAAAALLPASEVSVQIFNSLLSQWIPPRFIARMSFKAGIPDEFRTLVVVPTMLLTPDSIRDELDRLEVRYLANPEHNLLFALLTDFADAPSRAMPEDERLLEIVLRGIADLDARYGDGRFFLFHRAREWCQTEGKWIGWERKRGKLEDLNRFLSHDARQGVGDFLKIGNREILNGVRFVLTLDADTKLPPQSALRLVEAMAHPLNQPVVVANRRVVSEGYGVIQPRVVASLSSTAASVFSLLFANAKGTDPYAQAISDVYHDLFGESIFVGKAIYDVRAFHQTLSGRFPEQTLLSHDLIEGSHLRVGFDSTVLLFEQFPSSHQTFSDRQHRWIRGDWQIANWVLPRVPGCGGRQDSNPLSSVGRWKILDNLRRSLVPPACVLVLLGSWLIMPNSAFWNIFIALAIFIPAITPIPTRVREGVKGYFFVWRDQATELLRALVATALLPYHAWIAVDAGARALYRMILSRRNLLQWESAQVAHWRGLDNQTGISPRAFTVCAATTLFIAVLAYRGFSVWTAAAPYLALWLLSPLIVYWINRPRNSQTKQALDEEEKGYVRKMARETWRYFDDLVGPQSQWLPPDNSQESLRVEVAYRTSPTNIGLWLLSAVAAHDLGFLTIDQLLSRLSASFESIARLEKSHGHLLNWYDIKTLAPLQPTYVSTVDSGNLLASLWTLNQSLQEFRSAPIIQQESLQGLADTIVVLQEWFQKEAAVSDTIQSALLEILALCRSDRCGINEFWDAIHSIAAACDRLPSNSAQEWQGRAKDTGVGRETGYWLEKTVSMAQSCASTMQLYFGWVVTLLQAPPAVRLLPQYGEVIGRLSVQCPYSLEALAARNEGPLVLIHKILDSFGELDSDSVGWLGELRQEISAAQLRAHETLLQIQSLLGRSRELEKEMDLRWLYDPDRKLFSIGQQASGGPSESPSYYDLLASEARLASLVAIARGEVTSEHWQALGRPFGLFSRHKFLYSWSGSMFEYLMPLIFTRNLENTLLEHACNEAVSIQIEFGRSRKVPWGISESAYSALDANQIYQYRAAGVPALALKRDLGEDLVVAPYATALALLVDPHQAIRNMKALAQAGLRGNKGFYEAIDYSRERQDGSRGVVVYAYMAHHQGMSLLSMANVIRDHAIQRRFHSDLRVRAVEPLLYEGLPPSREVSYQSPMEERPPSRLVAAPLESISGRVGDEKSSAPKTQLYSNGSYSCMVTNSGGGYSRWREYDLTRWRADTTRDHWGSYSYIRDLDTGEFWSVSFHPTDKNGSPCSVIWRTDKTEFRRTHGGIEVSMDITVSPEDDAEVRRITLINRSVRKRRLDLTTYSELVLAPHASDRAHQAFNKLFIQTEALYDKSALLANRRSETEKESAIWVGQLFTGGAGWNGQFETGRARFLGRGRSLEHPLAMDGHLSNWSGSVIDPIFSIRKEVALEPEEKVRLAVIMLAADSRAGAMQLIDKYQDLDAADRAFDLAWNHAQISLRHIRIRNEDVQRFQDLASPMIFANGGLRAASERLRSNVLGQSRLWAFGISGDLPICAIVIDDPLDLGNVREVIQAHAFWHERGLKSDLVILNGEAAEYDRPLQQQLIRLIQIHSPLTGMDQPGGVFLRSTAQLSNQDLTLLLSAAHVVFIASRGSLAGQLARSPDIGRVPPAVKTTGSLLREPESPIQIPELAFDNGISGFTPDGCEFVIRLDGDKNPPVPWINILANPRFGALVDECGSGYAWYRNSQANRLTPWHNDPVAADLSTGIYLRDEESGQSWTATAAPIRESKPYVVHHGQGYSHFTFESHGIRHNLLEFVPVDDAEGSPVRIQHLQIQNHTQRPRRLTVTFYADWVLGRDREETQLHVVTSWDSLSNALLARNAYSSEFSNCIAFAAAIPAARSFTADRIEFLGRNGSATNPAALRRRFLSGRSGTGLDPCAAVQVEIEVNPGQSSDVAFLLGQSETIQDVRLLINNYANLQQIERSFQETRKWWDRLLSTIQVNTPEKSADVLLNRWLLYQTLSCRIWARSALYQSGGAYGFRDQLQDVMALVFAKPDLARQHILRAAGRQYLEGDVQHWWHPETGAGIRTRCSDDLLWLPYATAHYVQTTGDQTILDQRIPFLEGQPLKDTEQESYSIPSISITDGTLFEHCRRAIERGFRIGEHGLPLIGLCDWNDGFNRVGIGGKGESIWLAWFLMDVLRCFAQMCVLRGEQAHASLCDKRIDQLQSMLDLHGWDGEWYRRAYFDDGSVLGSHLSSECRIDSLAQSWAAISGNISQARTDQALQAVEQHLIRDSDKLVLLFTPPFHSSEPSPGYIKAYPQGVRENGGQYTHAALWVALAFLRQGDGKRAVELLRMLNPIEHTRSNADVARYNGEPYVLAGDIYSSEGYVGRAGWTWYTGSSAWMYRIWIEEVLGFKLRGKTLAVDPTIPPEWPGFSLKYNYGDSSYTVTVANPDHVGHGVGRVELDGKEQNSNSIQLEDDGRSHTVEIQLGNPQYDSGFLAARNYLPQELPR